jgi:glycosyltransferase involved in cell wall biosynthesis
VNVFLVTKQATGCCKWRGSIPAKYLAKRGHDVRFFTPGQRIDQTPDVVVFFRLDAKDCEDAVLWCKSEGIAIVYDVDDALDLVPAGNPSYTAARDRMPRYRFLLEQADVVTTTTPQIAEHLRALAGRDQVLILPNSVDPDEWPIAPRLPERKELRVGWSGGASHFTDLGNVLAAIRDAQRRRGFSFAIQGFCEEASLEEMYAKHVSLYGDEFRRSGFAHEMMWFIRTLKESGLEYEFYPTVPTDRHAARVRSLDLDIGITPLMANPFNRCKSAVKFYELAMVGAAVLASDVEPYSDEVPALARNNRLAWTNALLGLIDVDRTRLVREQRDWVLQNRNMERNVQSWEFAYRRAMERAQKRIAA